MGTAAARRGNVKLIINKEEKTTTRSLPRRIVFGCCHRLPSRRCQCLNNTPRLIFLRLGEAREDGRGVPRTTIDDNDGEAIVAARYRRLRGKIWNSIWQLRM